MLLSTTKDFERIVVQDIPLIDVRAPIEYIKGSFLNAVNLPLMNDEERHLVGTCYKEMGHDVAVELGHKLVSGEIKEKRILDWISFIKINPNALIFCFRGGLRSKIAQEWIYKATGKEITRLDGGYKSFRNYLLKNLEPTEYTSLPLLISGYTGSGKTALIKKFDNSIDLEAIANHRGSSFGEYMTPQPSQISFENNLSSALIKHRFNGYKYIILENEGSNIGKRFIPRDLVKFFNSGKVIVLELPFEERVRNTLTEYVIQAQQGYIATLGYESGLKEWYSYINRSLIKISKKLGFELYNEIIDSLNKACALQNNEGYHVHEGWITTLLKGYYDPMYLYQMEKYEQKIIFRGNSDEIYRYIRDVCNIGI